MTEGGAQLWTTENWLGDAPYFEQPSGSITLWLEFLAALRVAKGKDEARTDLLIAS